MSISDVRIEDSATDRRVFMQVALAGPIIASRSSPVGAASPAARDVFVSHKFAEHQVPLGEVTMNYATAGSADKPALLLLPGQTESWWGYEEAMQALQADYQVYAVDLRGQGRSTWTPRRYTLDSMGGDLVRFISLVIKRPVIVSGNSSGGLLAAWLSAFAPPGQVRACLYEDPPLFASEVSPLYGHSLKQAAGPMLTLYAKYLGDQWSVGDYEGLRSAVAADPEPILRFFPLPPTPAQNLKEYDPEWARAFVEGTVARSCPHEVMLSHVNTPVLLTQHFHRIDDQSGHLVGSLSDLQVAKTREIVAAAGAKIDFVSLPDAAHPMHRADPARFVGVLSKWASGLT